jgi:hypothetical protein
MIAPQVFVNVPLSASDVNVTEFQISVLLGYDEPGVDEFVSDMIRQSIQISQAQIHPKGGFVLIPVVEIIPEQGMVVLQNQSFKVGRRIAFQLKNAEYLAIFVGTIGAGVEKLSDKYFRDRDMLEGYIYNLIGSEAAESVAELIHNHVKNMAEEKDLKITNRFSPGYCNWDVAEQFKLFQLFDGQFADVTLTESALMHPVKSVSGIIGIGKHVVFKDYSCEQCGQPNCLFSKLKKKE